MSAENGSHSTPFATGNITTSPRKRERSEPPSLNACAKAVFYGPKHPLHGAYDEPVKTLTSASLMMSADEVYRFTEDTAAHKYAYPFPKLVVLGILAGAYIGFGYSLCCICAGLLSPELRRSQPGLFNFLFGIYGFPTGLMLCVVAGADLFTSNCMYSTVGVWEGQFGLYGWVRMLFVSYFSNLVGALLLVGLMSGGKVFAGRAEFLIELAQHKVDNEWGVVLMRGILGNWLVCLAVWQGNMARDFTGRFVGVFLPDAAFVSLGLEHCIANMFLIPMSMAEGSGISVGRFVGSSLIPSTLGNLLGGSLLVATAYACSLGTPGHWIQDSWEARLGELARWWRQRRATSPAGGASSAVGRGPGGGSGTAKEARGTAGLVAGACQLAKSGRGESRVPLTTDMSLGGDYTLPHFPSPSPHPPPDISIPADRGLMTQPPAPSPRRRSVPTGLPPAMP